MSCKVVISPLCFLLLLGCSSQSGSGGTAEPTSDRVNYEDANEREGVDVERSKQERAEREVGRKAAKPTLSFGALRIDPDEPKVGTTLRAEVEVIHSAGSYSDYDISWYVNDVERVGIRSETLDSRLGRFKKGDVVSFRVSTLDPSGTLIEASSKKVFIGNSTPEILTNASNRRGLDGLHLKAKDVDGDKISWAVKEGPPGVTISSDGRVRVRQVNLAEDFDGEVVISATDPDGASAEFHVPVKVNAAVEEKIGTKTTTKVHTRESMSDEQFEKANLDNLDRVESMSAEEFDAYTKRQEEAAEKRRK